MWIARYFSITLLLLVSIAAAAGTERTPQTDMLDAIKESVLRTAEYTGRSEVSPRVLAQMTSVARHEFVSTEQQHRAYLNTALSIEHGQTISQPLIVALMTDFLDPQPGDIVLEVGTGSGYQAAVLAGLVKQMYSIEIIPQLAASASAILQRLGYDNVQVKAGDGYLGWPEYAPFDGIIVTAAANDIPPPLIQQLKSGARLVIPLASPGGFQNLMVIEKLADGGTTSRSVLPVRFVPLTRESQH